MSRTLHVVINAQDCPVAVPESMLTEATAVFATMDADMDRGWQMSRVWVECPDRFERCQIVADRLLTAIENQNQKQATMLAAYILAAVPEIVRIDIATDGDMTATQIETEAQGAS